MSKKNFLSSCVSELNRILGGDKFKASMSEDEIIDSLEGMEPVTADSFKSQMDDIIKRLQAVESTDDVTVQATTEPTAPTPPTTPKVEVTAEDEVEKLRSELNKGMDEVKSMIVSLGQAMAGKLVKSPIETPKPQKNDPLVSSSSDDVDLKAESDKIAAEVKAGMKLEVSPW